VAERAPLELGSLARFVLVVDLVAQVVAGVQLVVLTRRTDDFFAWTIAVPATAALLGAGYWAGVPSVVLALRSGTWAEARIIFPMGLTITGFTALATFRHLDLFHLDSGPGSARFAAWAWVVVYIAVPLLLLVAFVERERAGGRAIRAVEVPLGRATRAVLLAHAVPLTVLGLGLTFAPGTFADLWPWSLTPLTARAVAAWLLTVAVASWWALRDGDWRRTRVAFPALVAFPVLALFGAARFAEVFDADDLRTWLYIAALVASAAAFTFVGVQHERGRQWRG
jgi:hypothetical protein